MTPAPAWSPSQRPLAPSVRSVSGPHSGSLLTSKLMYPAVVQCSGTEIVQNSGTNHAIQSRQARIDNIHKISLE